MTTFGFSLRFSSMTTRVFSSDSSRRSETSSRTFSEQRSAMCFTREERLTL